MFDQLQQRLLYFLKIGIDNLFCLKQRFDQFLLLLRKVSCDRLPLFDELLLDRFRLRRFWNSPLQQKFDMLWMPKGDLDCFL